MNNIFNRAAFIVARWWRIYRTIVSFGKVLDPWNTLTYYLVSRKKDIQRPRGGWKFVFSQYWVADDAYILQILTNIKLVLNKEKNINDSKLGQLKCLQSLHIR